MSGSNAEESSLIDQWFAYGNTTISPNQCKVLTGIFGTGEITQPAWAEALKTLKTHCRVLDSALEGRKWVVGN